MKWAIRIAVLCALFPYGHIANSSAIPLRMVGVVPRDVPSYAVVTAGTESPSSAGYKEGISATVLKAHGWKGGYSATYQARSTAREIIVQSSIDRYQTEAGARWGFVSWTRSIDTSDRAYRQVSPPVIGERRMAFTEAKKTIWLLIFERRIYVVALWVEDAAHASQRIDTLAKIIDRRASTS